MWWLFHLCSDAPGSTDTGGWCSLQNSGTMHGGLWVLGFIDVFLVVCWIFKFVVFSDGTNR